MLGLSDADRNRAMWLTPVSAVKVSFFISRNWVMEGSARGMSREK